jgi:hypothetical protein
MLSLLVQVIEANRPSCVRVHPVDWRIAQDELMDGPSSGAVYHAGEIEPPMPAGAVARLLGVPVILDAQVNRGCVAWDER